MLGTQANRSRWPSLASLSSVGSRSSAYHQNNFFCSCFFPPTAASWLIAKQCSPGHERSTPARNRDERREKIRGQLPSARVLCQPPKPRRGHPLALPPMRLPDRAMLPLAPPGQPAPAPQPQSAARAPPRPLAAAGSPWPARARGGTAGTPATAKGKRILCRRCSCQ